MPRQLYFRNPIFKAGRNVTVRKGTYWINSEKANILIDNVMKTVDIKTRTMQFRDLTVGMLRDEHNPICRTLAGLYLEMCGMYKDFTRYSVITIISFKL